MVAIPGGTSAKALAASRVALEFAAEAWKHGKPILASGNGKIVLENSNIVTDPTMGVIVEDNAENGATAFVRECTNIYFQDVFSLH